MSIVHLLLVVSALLGSGSIALLFVRMAATQFASIGWIGAAFASASLSTILMLLAPETLGGVLSDFTVLLTFVLLHVAIIALSENRLLVPRLGGVLLFLEIVAGIYISKGIGFPHLRSEILALFVALQAGDSALQVFQAGKGIRRSPVWFLATNLIGFMIFNFLRYIWLSFGGVRDAVVLSTVEEITFAVYVASLLGFALGFFWLTTELQATRLEDMAGTDPLTRAANRRNFLIWCEQERERSLRSGAGFSVVMVDIDHFKQINDTFGHATGDIVICDVVDRVRDAIRGIDVLGRWGGEEFVVLLRECSLESARIVAERIRSNVEHMDPSAAALRYRKQSHITVSVGIASHQPEEAIAELIARADTALYDAKAAGRNRVGISSADLPEALPEPPEPQPTPVEEVVFAIPRFSRTGSHRQL